MRAKFSSHGLHKNEDQILFSLINSNFILLKRKTKQTKKQKKKNKTEKKAWASQ